jgi:hypothetical protein
MDPMMPPRALERTASMAPDGNAEEIIAAVACPYCKRPVGKYCVDPKSGRAARVHVTRVWRARRCAR